MGADERQLLASPDCFRQVARSEGAAEALSQSRQCRKNDGGAGYGNSRL
jgi:hypothetical protein